MRESIGFIGIGIMGGGMVRNLAKAGFRPLLWNRTRERLDALAAEGFALAADPAELAASSDVVITCVSDTPDVEAVLFGERGVVEGLRPGSLVIDMSTISPIATVSMGERLAEKDVQMLDAPISGGSEGAAQGTLSIMVGGDEGAVERAMPLLRAMGKAITHVGPLGSGQKVKLVNQILVVVNALAVSEALVFAEAAGLDLEKTLEAVVPGAAGSWMLANRGPQVIRRDWRPGFTVDLQQKDLRLVLEAADQLGTPVVATGLVFHLYRTLQAEGLGGEGNHALVKAIERLSGIQVGSAGEG